MKYQDLVDSITWVRVMKTEFMKYQDLVDSINQIVDFSTSAARRSLLR